MAKTQKLVSKDSIGEALHCALRKCCNSTPTSLLWNLFRFIDNGVWEKYLDIVYLNLIVEEKAGTKRKDWEVLKETSLAFRKTLEEKRDGKIEWSAVQCLYIVFGMLDDGDWKGYASFLRY
jgi:hypothetical protein